jgi:hypothetical protein
MTKVRLLVPRVGDKGAEEIGAVVDVPDEEAVRLFREEYAEPYEERSTEPETAMLEPAGEKMVLPAGKGRKTQTR